MSTLAFQPTETAMDSDDFAALEQRVLRAVDLLKAERSARIAAEERAAELQQKLEALASQSDESTAEIEAYKGERELVRTRVERLLRQLDDITA